MSETRSNFSCWIKKGENLFIPSDNVQVQDRLAPGAYRVGWNRQEERVVANRIDIKTDGLIQIPQPEVTEVMACVNEFFNQKEEFAKWDFVFKRGFLLYGVPGGGKTSIINTLITYVTEQLDGVVFVIHNEDDLDYYSTFITKCYRDIEPNRMVMTVFEDIDGLCRNETLLINTLDGIGNSSNILNIATTNYTERLPERITNRPNRFDRRFEIKSPNAEARKYYFEHKILAEYLPGVDIDEWVKRTEGLTLAQLSEVIKSVFLFNQELDEVIAVLKDLKKVPSSSNYNKSSTDQGLGYGFKTKVTKYETKHPIPVEASNGGEIQTKG